MTNRGSKLRRAKLSAADRAGELRLAVNLPPAMHRQLKAKAAEAGTSIRDYIVELLRRDGIR